MAESYPPSSTCDLDHTLNSESFEPHNPTFLDDTELSSRKSDSPKLKRQSSVIHKISLGICAMRKKARSKPMRAILNHLNFSEKFDIVEFDQDMILNDPIESWPKVECLIAFDSGGFPYQKAIQYVEKYQPFLVNDLH